MDVWRHVADRPGPRRPELAALKDESEGDRLTWRVAVSGDGRIQIIWIGIAGEMAGFVIALAPTVLTAGAARTAAGAAPWPSPPYCAS